MIARSFIRMINNCKDEDVRACVVMKISFFNFWTIHLLAKYIIYCFRNLIAFATSINSIYYRGIMAGCLADNKQETKRFNYAGWFPQGYRN